MSTMKVNRIENTSTTDGGIDINTSGNVGIGTSSPSSNLDVEAATGDATLRIHAAENNSGSEPTLILESSNDFAESVIDFKDSSGTAGGVRYNHGDNALRFLGKGINGEAMRIDSSGNLSFSQEASSNYPEQKLKWSNDSTTTNGFYISQGTDRNGKIWHEQGLDIQFATNNTERMRIDSSGRLLVGTSSQPSGSNTNLVADFGEANSGTQIASISVGSGSYRIFNAMVPAVNGSAQTTATLNFQFNSSYGIAVIEIDLVGGLAQIGVGKYVAIVDCDTSSGQTAQLSTPITTVASVGYGSPVFSSGGASVSPSFSIAFTRSSPNGENWGAYWKATVKTSSNSYVAPCVLTSITMS